MITDIDKHSSRVVQLVADFGTLLGTYDKGFAVIIEPWDGRLPQVPDPVIQLACLDASLAMKPVFDKFQVSNCALPVRNMYLAYMLGSQY